MPQITRLFIKASLVFLVIALAIQVGLATRVFPAPFSSGLSAVFFHFFLVGWVTQMIIGVAYWMLPKYSREKPRRNETLAWVVFLTLNVGLVMRGLAEPLTSQEPSFIWNLVLAISATLQWIGGLLFVFNSWARVKER